MQRACLSGPSLAEKICEWQEQYAQSPTYSPIVIKIPRHRCNVNSISCIINEITLHALECGPEIIRWKKSDGKYKYKIVVTRLLTRTGRATWFAQSAQSAQSAHKRTEYRAWCIISTLVTLWKIPRQSLLAIYWNRRSDQKAHVTRLIICHCSLFNKCIIWRSQVPS